MDHARGPSSSRSVGQGPALGSDVFISYAREDRRFVVRLHDALLADGQQAWVDWEGIPASAKWMAEVRSAIDAAAAFCFVISPDSAESAVCREEAAHAASSNKRIVPILVRAVDAGLVPEAVVAHSWVDFTDEQQFDQAFRTLSRAIAVDPEWTHSHTRLLVRANEWEASGRDEALLLRGADLVSAEQWLTNSGSADPPPARQHTVYILASRRHAIRRQRRFLAAVSVALGIALLLSGIAFVERAHAQHERQVAENQSLTALSDLLGARSRVALDDAPDRALLLAVSAWQVKPSLEARDALFRAVENVPQAEAFFASSATLSDTEGPLSLSPDQSTLASGGTAGLRLWNVPSRTPIGAPLTTKDVVAIAFSPDGSRVAAAESGGDLVVWAVRTRHRVLEPTTSGRIDSLAFSPDGTTLATAGTGGVRFWSTSTGLATGQLMTHYARLVAFSPDGRILATAGSLGPNDEGALPSNLTTHQDDLQLWVWDAANWTPLGHLASTDTQDISFSPDGSLLAAVGEAHRSGGGPVQMFAVGTRQRIGSQLPARARAVAFEPNGRTVITAGPDGLQQWAVTINTAGRPLDTGGALDSGITEDVAVLGDGVTFITAGNFGIVQWKPQRFEPLRRVRAGLASDVAFSSVGHQVIAGSDNHGIQLLAMADRSSIGRARGEHGVPTRSLAVSADSRTLVTAGSSGVRLWRVSADLDLIKIVTSKHADLVALSPDGRTVAAVLPTGNARDPSGLWLWDVSGDRPRGVKVSTVSGMKHALAFSADGHVLAVAGDAGLQLFNVGTRRAIGGSITTSQTWAVAFNPDGRALAFATSGGVAFWDLSTNRPVGEPLPVNVQGVGHAMAFSPDGAVLATTLAGHGLQLWDAGARQPLGAMLETSSTSAVAFSEDGGALAAGGITTTVWDLRVDAWIEQACAIANRDLTQSEWDTYVGAEFPYRETCDTKTPSSR